MNGGSDPGGPRRPDLTASTWPRNGVEKLRLRPAMWVRLPDTDHEVLLHGRMRGNPDDGTEIRRSGGPAMLRGWNLRPVIDCCYVRTAR